MNLCNVAGSRDVSYSFLGSEHTHRSKGNHRNLIDSHVYQENGQSLQCKTVKAYAPYELWISSQKPRNVLLLSGKTDVQRDAADKLSSCADHSTATVLANAERFALKENGKDAVNALLAEKTSCTYPVETGDGGLSEAIWLTFYEKDRIYCIREGGDGYEWEMPLEDETQYDKVMSFLNGLKDKENLRFASRQIFWQDFLSGELDMEGFQNFLDTKVQKGIPDYTYVTENGVCFDREAVRFSKYVDEPFCEVIATTEKEFLDYCMAELAKKLSTMQEEDPIEKHYRMFGDRGQRIHYFHGKLYTYEEYYPLDLQEAREAMAKAGNLIEDFYTRNGWPIERIWEVTSSVGKRAATLNN